MPVRVSRHHQPYGPSLHPEVLKSCLPRCLLNSNKFAHWSIFGLCEMLERDGSLRSQPENGQSSTLPTKAPTSAHHWPSALQLQCLGQFTIPYLARGCPVRDCFPHLLMERALTGRRLWSPRIRPIHVCSQFEFEATYYLHISS
jgi:hypothetical protein